MRLNPRNRHSCPDGIQQINSGRVPVVAKFTKPPEVVARRELVTAALQWLDATLARDFAAQSAFYPETMDAFYQWRDVPKGAVMAEKRRVFEQARTIDIRMDPPQLLINSGACSRRVLQELRWVKQADDWIRAAYSAARAFELRRVENSGSIARCPAAAKASDIDVRSVRAAAALAAHSLAVLSAASTAPAKSFCVDNTLASTLTRAAAECAWNWRGRITRYFDMDPWHVIEQLYDSQINAGLETDWDCGVQVWIAGGGRRLAQHYFLRREFDEVGAWLDREARLLFPRSQYAIGVQMSARR